jgi:hypothetical protein
MLNLFLTLSASLVLFVWVEEPFSLKLGRRRVRSRIDTREPAQHHAASAGAI